MEFNIHQILVDSKVAGLVEEVVVMIMVVNAVSEGRAE
jgi:hypothetical protein